MLTPDRYPLRHLSTGTSMVTKGSGWQLQCRCSLSRLSQRGTKTLSSARPSKTARRLSRSICANSTFNVISGRWGGDSGYAEAVNELSDIVGMSQTGTGTYHATLWTVDGVIVDLDTLGSAASIALALNDHGQIVE